MTGAEIPPGYGYLNHCEEDGPELVFGGWLLLPDGPFDRIDVIVLETGQRLPATIQEEPSLKAAWPHVPGAERGRFVRRVPLSLLELSGTLELRVIGVRGGRDVAQMTFGYHRPSCRSVLPPGEMMHRATGNVDRSYYLATGIKACNDFRSYLAPHCDLDGVRSILDWGCGTGRVTRHLIDRFPRAVVHGADIDREAVEWAARNLRGRFVPCDRDPPLPYEGSSFDLVVALSVFTHLTRKYQRVWLEELARVVRPGKLLLATTHGPFAGRWWLREPGEYEQVFATGFFDGLGDDRLAHVAGKDYYKKTFQTGEYTEQNWSGPFEILDQIEGGLNNLQDVFILRRRSTCASST